MRSDSSSLPSLGSQLQPCFADSQGLRAVQWPCIPRDKATAHSSALQTFPELWQEFSTAATCYQHKYLWTFSWQLPCPPESYIFTQWESEHVFKSILLKTYL